MRLNGEKQQEFDAGHGKSNMCRALEPAHTPMMALSPCGTQQQPQARGSSPSPSHTTAAVDSGELDDEVCMDKSPAGVSETSRGNRRHPTGGPAKPTRDIWGYSGEKGFGPVPAQFQARFQGSAGCSQGYAKQESTSARRERVRAGFSGAERRERRLSGLGNNKDRIETRARRPRNTESVGKRM